MISIDRSGGIGESGGPEIFRAFLLHKSMLWYKVIVMEIFSSTIIAAVALLFVLEGVMCFFIWKTNKRIAKFFNGSHVKTVEKVLEYELRKMQKTEKDIKTLIDNMKWIEGVARKSASKVGVVRYNPFQDIGGDQSFSIALLDYSDNGVVVSALHGQDGTRVYAKPIIKGNSEHQLTKEEYEAIKRSTT